MPGEYQVELKFNKFEDLSSLDQTKLALRADLGSKCQKLISIAELDKSLLQSFNCSFDRELYLQVRAYWFGYAPVSVDTLKISSTE